MAKSSLIWFGGKGKVAKRHIIPRIPEHRYYREPFAGACHVIAQKDRSTHEVINDIDANLVNFLIVINADPERFVQEALKIPYSRYLYDQYRNEGLPRDPFERAVRWFYLNRSAISKGNAREIADTGWRHSNSSNQNPASGYVGACERLVGFAERMRGVMVECMDFKKFIPKYDTDDKTVWYVDPPYVGREKFYAGGFTEADHVELARLLNSAKGKVIVSYYNHPSLEELYTGWRKVEFVNHRQVVGGSNNFATEILLMNFESEEAEEE